MRKAARLPAALAFLGALLAGTAYSAPAARWTPAAWEELPTLEFLTVGPEEGEHWSTVWLVVIEGEMYVRLGKRSAGRIRRNKTAPFVSVRIAGVRFDRVRAEAAPARAGRVARAMADKYWEDFFIRLFPHPLTMRLRPGGAAGQRGGERE